MATCIWASGPASSRAPGTGRPSRFSIGAEMVAAATYIGVLVSGRSRTRLGRDCVGAAARREPAQRRPLRHVRVLVREIKVVVIAAFMVLGAALMLSGRTAAAELRHGGWFPNGRLATLLALPFAIYTFAGVEFVAVASGEARSRGEIARATRLTFAILAVVYLGAIVVLTGIIPWNHAGVHESPFVTVFRTVHVPGAGHLMNFVVLTAALSGANAALYSALAHVVRARAQRVGARGARQAEPLRIADARGHHILVLHRRGARSRAMGASAGVRLDSERRAVRAAVVVAGLAGGACAVSPWPRDGFHDRLRAGSPGDRENLVGLAHRSCERCRISAGFECCVHSSFETRTALIRRGKTLSSGTRRLRRLKRPRR